MSDTGPAHRVQSAAVEYGYPQGHLGHLTNEEEAALKNFKALCAENHVYTPAEGDKPASHDDATLLRFLRARRFDLKGSLGQFSTTEKWRKANEIDKLYETIDLKQYDDTRRLYPQWTGRRDRRGIPVYVFEVKHLNSKTMSAYEKSAAVTNTQAKSDGSIPPKLLRLFALYENLTRFAMPLSTALPDRENRRTPITQSNNIVDISNVGLKQFWNLRAHMQDASTLATAHYPETLDRIFIIGAPAFFPTVWSWIKKWFDPITTSKIFILSSSDMKKTLESFIDIENIPEKYGGKLKFEFGDKGPTLDPILEQCFEWNTEEKDYPVGPLYWRKAEKDGKGVLELVECGSENGQPRNGVVGVLHTENTEEDLMNMESEVMKVATNGSANKLQVPGSPAATGETTPKAVEAGELVPANRPLLETYVTASEGLPLSPSYSGPIFDVPGTNSRDQEATEQELANGIETPEEVSSPEIAKSPVSQEADAAALPKQEPTAVPIATSKEAPPAAVLKEINGEAETRGRKVESPASPTSPTSAKHRIGELGEKFRSSFDSLGKVSLGKRDGSLGRTGSLKSEKSLGGRIKEKLVK